MIKMFLPLQDMARSREVDKLVMNLRERINLYTHELTMLTRYTLGYGL